MDHSRLLREKKEEVLSLWEQRALKEIPSSVKGDSLTLRDALPTYLDHMIRALALNRKMDVESVLIHNQEGVRVASTHGSDRAGSAGYLLAEVIFEYHILRESIFQVLEKEGPLPQIPRDIIINSIEQAVNDAAVTFTEFHADIQQKFINTLTHDLKNPISIAKASAQMILEKPKMPDDCLGWASKIVGSMNRLTSMIHDLLDASRLRAGESLSFQFIHCDLASVTREVVEEMSAIHGDRFKFESNGAIEGSWGCDGLRRAIENLLDNAVKYSSPNTPITVSLRREKQGAKLTVHNQGPPIPKSEIPLLFQQHRRAKSASQASKTGWGLGLTLVKGVVDAHNGKIRVDTEAGKGTSFTLEIPQDPNPNK